LLDRHIYQDLQSKTNRRGTRKDEGVLNPDRKTIVEAATMFIERYNVTHYFTLTYPRRRGAESRHKAFLEWIDAIEWMQRRPLGWFRADEMIRFSGLERPAIPEHHHGLFIDTKNLCCRTAEDVWRYYGDAKVERYEHRGGAIPYCLKQALFSSEWDLGGKALRGFTLR
jgi:hypothetical protein